MLFTTCSNTSNQGRIQDRSQSEIIITSFKEWVLWSRSNSETITYFYSFLRDALGRCFSSWHLNKAVVSVSRTRPMPVMSWLKLKLLNKISDDDSGNQIWWIWHFNFGWVLKHQLGARTEPGLIQVTRPAPVHCLRSSSGSESETVWASHDLFWSQSLSEEWPRYNTAELSWWTSDR